MQLRAGRRSSFEISFGDELLHSKLDTQEWPDTDLLLEAIAKRLPG